jgi:rhodanese-related sulfurtransferase/preprotein translocase subunit Sss1
MVIIYDKAGKMDVKPGNKKFLILLIILATGLLPIGIYWFTLGAVPSVDPEEALARLEKSHSSALLLDVRDGEDFRSLHINGARNWPFARLMAIRSKEQIPPVFRDRPLLLICRSGIMSALAAQKLRGLSVDDVYSIRGGIQAWIAIGSRTTPRIFRGFAAGSGQGVRAMPFPFRELPVLVQWVAAAAAFGVKPLYMLLSLVLIILLRRRRSGDILALRWALIFFLVGESFCAVNYLWFNENSYLIEYFHIAGMVLSFGFLTYALMEGLDKRVIKYGEMAERCAALKLCGSCYKHGDFPCKLRRVFIFLLLCLVILSLIPLSASPFPISYNTTILGTPYHYSHPVVYQLFEIRYAPWAAVVFFAAALWVMWRSKERGFPLAKIFVSVGVGFLAFSFFRLVLFAVYRDNLTWFVGWEEFTELMYVAGVGIFLWIFRQRIFQQDKP